MKTYEEYQEYLASHGVPSTLVEISKEFVLKMHNLYPFDRIGRRATEDLGKYEYREYTNLDQIIAGLKACVMQNIDYDTDSLGRDQSQRKLKIFMRDPGKSWNWMNAKGYFLFVNDFYHGENKVTRNSLGIDWDALYSDRYDREFPSLWEKRLQLDAERTMRILKRAA